MQEITERTMNMTEHLTLMELTVSAGKSVSKNLFAQLNFKYNVNKGFRGVGDEVLTHNRVSYRSGGIKESLLQKTDVRPEI